jgi:hypothetical protein
MMEDVKMKEGLSQVRRAGYFCRMMKVGVVEPGALQFDLTLDIWSLPEPIVCRLLS